MAGSGASGIQVGVGHFLVQPRLHPQFGSNLQQQLGQQGRAGGIQLGSSLTAGLNSGPIRARVHAWGQGLGRFALAGFAAAGVAKGITAIFKTGLGEQKDYAAGLAKLQAGLKSTGNQAGLSAGDMENLASKIQNYSGQTDDSIVATEQLLLTFTNVKDVAGKGNDVFTQTTKIAADMAARLGGDASSAAIQLGKALNDPIRGITALQRVGVSFDNSQKATIKTLVQSGNVLGAQKIILAELNKEFGGSAKAVGDTLPGKIERGKRAFEDLSQSVVATVAPLAEKLLPAVTGFLQTIGPPLLGAIGKAGQVLVTLGHAGAATARFFDHNRAVAVLFAAVLTTILWPAITRLILVITGAFFSALTRLGVLALGASARLRAVATGALTAARAIVTFARATPVLFAVTVAIGAITAATTLFSKKQRLARIDADALTEALKTQASDGGQAARDLFVKALQGSDFGSKGENALQYLRRYKVDITALYDAVKHGDTAGVQSLIDPILKAGNVSNFTKGRLLGFVEDLENKYQGAAVTIRDAEAATKDFTAKQRAAADAGDAAARAQDALKKANAESYQAVSQANTALSGQISLLDGVANQSKITGAELLKNAQDALTAFRDETANIQALTAKGLDPTAIKALVDKGPQYVQAANSLSLQDLQSWASTYQQGLSAQWNTASTITGLGADKASRAAIDHTLAAVGDMHGAAGKVAAEITLAYLHETPKAYAQAKTLYTLVQGQIDQLHGTELQVLLDDLASNNIGKLRADLAGLQGQLSTLQQTNILGVPGADLLERRFAGMAAGGRVPGFDSHSRDRAGLFALSHGEWVMPTPITAKYGDGAMAAVHSGKAAITYPGMAAGGRVTIAPSPTASSSLWRQLLTSAPLAGQFANFDGNVGNAVANVGMMLSNAKAIALAGSGAALGAGVTRWIPLILTVLGMLGQPKSLLPNVLAQMNLESGGNPFAINLWDSNAAIGQPSKGLMQTIDTTFAAYAGPFAGLGIYNPLANTYAGLNYAAHTGGIARLHGTQGYAGGGLARGWSVVGERGAELINAGSGSQVLSHEDSMRALGGRGAGPFAGATIVLQDRADAEHLANQLDWIERQGNL